jgi:hypothetical protein
MITMPDYMLAGVTMICFCMFLKLYELYMEVSGPILSQMVFFKDIFFKDLEDLSILSFSFALSLLLWTKKNTQPLLCQPESALACKT